MTRLGKEELGFSKRELYLRNLSSHSLDKEVQDGGQEDLPQPSRSSGDIIAFTRCCLPRTAARCKGVCCALDEHAACETKPRCSCPWPATALGTSSPSPGAAQCKMLPLAQVSACMRSAHLEHAAMGPAMPLKHAEARRSSLTCAKYLERLLSA